MQRIKTKYYESPSTRETSLVSSLLLCLSPHSIMGYEFSSTQGIESMTDYGTEFTLDD